jgi:hypothetical protein
MKQQAILRYNLRKIIKMRGRYMALFALLLVAFSNSLWSAEVDTVWVSDINELISFQHTLTKNIIVNGGNKLLELDSKYGKLVKEIEFGNVFKLDLTPDGSKLLSVVLDDTYIYEYPSMELIIKLENSRLTKFANNSEVITETTTDIDYSILAKYNFITKEKTFFNPVGNIQDIATSFDGRFIAISTNAIVGSNEDWTKLILVDAKTMKQIKQLEENKNTGHKFERMNFSKDGKYLAYFSALYNEDFQRNIYSTETLKSVKNYNLTNLKASYVNIDFLDEKHYVLYNGDYINSKYKYQAQVIDINTDKTLLTLNSSSNLIFNKVNNHIYFNDSDNKKIVCLNVSNLITGVTPNQPTTIINYQNKQLTIYKKNVIKVEISDISGRLIMNKIIENPFSNNTVLPLNLANGSYLINVITEKESFTHKLMVME